LKPSETRATRVDKFRMFWGLPNCEQALFLFGSRGSAFRGAPIVRALVTKHVVSAGTA